MWISQKLRSGAGTHARVAEMGEISIGGAHIAAVTQSEKRELAMALPGGVFWRPRAGQRVLVLTTADGESVVAGAVPEPLPELEAGELRLEGKDCTLRLRSGQAEISARGIVLDGAVDISGALTVNGEPYRPCTCTSGGLG